MTYKIKRSPAGEEKKKKQADEKYERIMKQFGSIEAYQEAKSGRQGKKKKKQPHMILTTGVKEGPAKRHTTMKTFEIYKDDIDGTSIRLAKRGGGRAYGKNS